MSCCLDYTTYTKMYVLLYAIIPDLNFQRNQPSRGHSQHSHTKQRLSYQPSHKLIQKALGQGCSKGPRWSSVYSRHYKTIIPYFLFSCKLASIQVTVCFICAINEVINIFSHILKFDVTYVLTLISLLSAQRCACTYGIVW